MSSIGLLKFLSRHPCPTTMHENTDRVSDGCSRKRLGRRVLCSSPMSDAAATGSILEARRGGVVVSRERSAVVDEQYS